MKITKKAITVIIVIIVAITVTCVITYIDDNWYSYPTHYLYDDHWVIGKSADQIEQRYGAYDYNSETIYGSLIKGYCVKESGTDWWGDATWPEYYMIYFDENGKAYEVDVVVGGWGG